MKVIIKSQYQWSPQVRFQPWVGSNYGPKSVFGFGVLALGESHYGSEADYSESDLTSWVVKDYIDRRSSLPIFTKVGNCLFENYTREQAADFWSQLAFYNYLRSFKGDGPQGNTTRAEIDGSKSPFIEVVSVLKPALVIVIGKTLWDRWLPNDLAIGEEFAGQSVDLQGIDRCLWRYKLLEYSFFCGYLTHPSAGGGYFRAEIEAHCAQTYIGYVGEFLAGDTGSR